ncbi:cuticle-degrading protease [Fusarium beomiforme]|uniref:Cuticle-degrading protease n=1 Tax=Fusarium beomiforme TaxID=44412 RepID=A0A9P5E5F2_9HYPO|nr:cuticle-degrading protease [Fusarium beomiforme]
MDRSRKIITSTKPRTSRVPSTHYPLVTRRYTAQINPPWNLAQISQRDITNGISSRYYYDTAAGSGATVYVIDSGINFTHPEFSSRAVPGANFVIGTTDDDNLGHGTHVAGIIGSRIYGMAKHCEMISVKVLGKTGETTKAVLLLGIKWAISDAKTKGITHKSVMNISGGVPYDSNVNNAIKEATDAGITVVVAARNACDGACCYSPASAPFAITVAASGFDDHRVPYSNYGPAVDIFAPGMQTPSAWSGSVPRLRYYSGTSMAAPHVASLAAYFISTENLRGSDQVRKRLLESSLVGVIQGARNSRNRLACNPSGGY